MDLSELKEGNTVPHGLLVRLRDNPSVQGLSTGKGRVFGSHFCLEVALSSNERQFFRVNLLEEAELRLDPIDLYLDGKFGTAEDLRRLLSYSRMALNLTNVLYSMESSNTEFMPHQFKPVLKFLESPTGRLLIADEVGLGKTIEAAYIWQELQARSDARRLLVICPSVLREKWVSDLWVRFGIEAQLADAKDILEHVDRALSGGRYRPCCLVASLESIRVREEDADPYSNSVKDRLAAALLAASGDELQPIFDLVIVDEAHYLRNSATASHQTAAMLRDTASHVLLLSATPLQTSEENLFNLLRLLAPESYTDREAFLSLYEANTAVVRAASALLGDQDPSRAIRWVNEALGTRAFDKDRTLLDLSNRLGSLSTDPMDLEERVSWYRRLDGVSLFGAYVSRSRKRDVFLNRVVRHAHAVNVALAPLETEVYQQTTAWIQERFNLGDMARTFTLVARQRQLASSFYAAIKGWIDRELEDDDDGEFSSVAEGANLPSLAMGPLAKQFDLDGLWECDTKYKAFRDALKSALSLSIGEKVVVFSYYRATISYLCQRLAEDGVDALTLRGGMGPAKWDVLKQFAAHGGPRVLISSEVGSEGIDLQFCRVMFNYDLPWNPMRLEQRIGRIDRIGQKSEAIEIYNLFRSDTIEDRVIQRLYERIEIFKNAMGDIEEILGPFLEEVSAILVNPALTVEEKERQIEANQLALLEKRRLLEDLEEAAGSLSRHGTLVLEEVGRHRRLHRWVGPDEIYRLVIDFLGLRYPQVGIQKDDTTLELGLDMTEEAAESLRDFCRRTRQETPGRLAQSRFRALCHFDPKRTRTGAPSELVLIAHPLVRWILESYRENLGGLYPTGAVRASIQGFPPGVYSFAIQLWNLEGAVRVRQLRYAVVEVTTRRVLDGESSEELVQKSASHGASWADWSSKVPVLALQDSFGDAVEALGHQFDRMVNQAQQESNALCDRQKMYLEKTRDRKRQATTELIDRLQAQGRVRTLPVHRAKLASLEAQYLRSVERVEAQRGVVSRFNDVATGIIWVE